MKYFIYTRKSTEDEERQVLSLTSQIEKVKEAFPDLDTIEMPPESASAFKPNNRPIFNEMIERIDAGEAHGILAWHPDRLSRNELDAAALTYRLRRNEIRDLKFASYTFDNSPEGIMMLQMVMSQSQYFSAKLSKDVKRGNEKKLRMGWKPGVAPSGYLNTPDLNKGSKIIIKDPERFDTVRKIWEMMLTGAYSVPSLLEILNVDYGFTTKKTLRLGGKPLSRSSLYGILTNPFYAGLIRYNGELYNGSHDPMITSAEFDRVQKILGSKGRPRPQVYDFTYKGIMECGECGCAITAEQKIKYVKSLAKTVTYIYYHCTRKRPCSQRTSITETSLNIQISSLLDSITIIPEFKDWAIDVLRRKHRLEIGLADHTVSNLSKSIDTKKKELSNLTRLRLKEFINDDEYIQQKETINHEIRKIQENIDATSSQTNNWIELAEKALGLATNASIKFSKADAITKRTILLALGTKFHLINGELEIELNKWLIPIQNNQKKISKVINQVRTKKGYQLTDVIAEKELKSFILAPATGFEPVT